MIDYVKIRLTGVSVERLRTHEKLEFKTEICEKTGEASNVSTAVHHFCKIKVYNSGRILFTGSIHKLWNSLTNILAPNCKENLIYNGYNGNQFNLVRIEYVICYLCDLFDCTPSQMEIENIEFGVNTNTLFQPINYISSMLYHYGKPFEIRYNRHYAQVEHQRYLIKVYDKSNQYGMIENTLRVELKIIKSKELQRLGIKTCADINSSTLNSAKELLIKRINEIMYFDASVNTQQLTEHEKRKLNEMQNVNHWLNLAPNKRGRPKKFLRKIIQDHSNNFAQQIIDDIEAKCIIINRSSIGLNVIQ